MAQRGLWVVLAVTTLALLPLSITVVAAPDNAMAVDVDQSNEPGAQASSVQPVGVPFQVSFDITDGTNPWAGYNLLVDHAGLTFIPTSDLDGDTVLESWDYTGLGGSSLNAVVSVPQPGRLQGGSAIGSGTSTAAGQAVVATFQCTAEGVFTLHLVTSGEAITFSTSLATGGVVLPTTLTDATVTCGAGGPMATPSAPTATPGGPAPTPEAPGATPTPLPPGYEAVTLSAACNPVTTTYPNATPAQSIAAAVGPAGNLQALWKFGGAVWMGYSPAFPQASDLTALDFLDVVFVCVGSPGSFARPIV
jgi:hypothetical protein